MQREITSLESSRVHWGRMIFLFIFLMTSLNLTDKDCPNYLVLEIYYEWVIIFYKKWILKIFTYVVFMVKKF